MLWGGGSAGLRRRELQHRDALEHEPFPGGLRDRSPLFGTDAQPLQRDGVGRPRIDRRVGDELERSEQIGDVAGPLNDQDESLRVIGEPDLRKGTWELVVADDRPRPMAGTGVDAVIRARRRS